MSLVSPEYFFQEDTEKANTNTKLAQLVSPDKFFSGEFSEEKDSDAPSVTQQGSSDNLVSPDKFFDTDKIIEPEEKDPVILPAFKPKMTQIQLIDMYSKEYPDFFEDGKLIDKIGAEEAGIVTEVTTTEDGTPLAPELYSLRYRTKDELEQFKENVTKSKLPLRFKNYVPVEEQTKNMLKEDLSKRPIFRTYVNTFGETGLDAIGYFMNAFNYVRGATADAYQSVHETIDELTDGGATKATNMDAKTAAKRFTGDVGAALEVSEAAPFVKLAATVKTARKAADEIANAEIKKQKKILKTATVAQALHDRRFNTTKIKQATYTAEAKAKQKAKDLADKNLKIKEDLIKAFEQKIGARSTGNIDDIIDSDKLISKMAFGRLTLDPAKARVVGRNQAKEISDPVYKDYVDQLELFGVKENPLVNPILNEDFLDPLVAVVHDLSKKNPNAFGKGKTLIDDLFKLTVNKELQASSELTDLLVKYNLPYEKYIMSVIGSGSQAGTILQKFSQMKKAQRVGERLINAKEMKSVNEKPLAWKFFLRFLNIGRGAMVSQLATMVRNVRSALYRSPMEGLGNVLDNAMYQFGEGNFLKGVTSLSPVGLKVPKLTGTISDASPIMITKNWKNSFMHMRYLYDDMGDFREFSDFLLDRPEFADEYSRLYNTLNEIQKVTGRGEATSRFGKVMDFLLSEGEDFVTALNIPNRWQEHIIRTSYFNSTLERLVKQEYGLDLIKELKRGKLNDFIQNSSSVVPKKARKFEELITDSVENALRNTYAAQPQLSGFRWLSNSIAKSGLTVLVAFPRFLFSSLELMGKYSGGALAVPIRRAIDTFTGAKKPFSKLDATDRDLISKNLVGLGALYGMMEYDKSQYSATDYRKIKMGDGKEIDSTPEFPVRQFRYLSRLGNEFLKGWFMKAPSGKEPFTDGERIKNGVDYLRTTNLLDTKEVMETFLGQNLRFGREFTVIEDYASLFADSDLTIGEKLGKGSGGAIGNFAQRYFVPYGMVIDAERALGLRTDMTKETAEETDLTFGGAFTKAFTRPFRRRGIMSPVDESQLNDKVYAFDPDGKRRINPGMKLTLGLSFYEEDPPPTDVFKQFGFDTFQLSSKAGSVFVRDRQNKLLQIAIPTIAEVVKSKVASNDALSDDDPNKLNRIELRKEIRSFIKDNIQGAKEYFGDLKYFFPIRKELSAEEKRFEVSMGLFEQQITSFRRKPPLFRSRAISQFKNLFDRDIVVTPTYPEDILDKDGKVLYKKGSPNMDITIMQELGKSKDQNIFK